MTNYYFTKNPDVIHDEKEWTFELLNNEFKFTTDNGVFSKKTVDFGSRVLLNAFAQQEIIAGNILDVGCGYGPIGLAIAKDQPERQIDMTDVNELALELAKKNAEINKIINVSIFESAAYDNVTKTDYATIVTNPPIRAGKNVVHDILSGAFDHLKVGGQLFAVLQKKQGAGSAQKKMTDVFGNCEIILKDKGYYILMSVK
ncbi:class I SAM-dependent methyltransferase [Dellaglioa algida]|uniref:16S RNA G1207 methylase RsmC n=1 Tax=Dellaglioa algida TaxID=105612 RepID=A0A5C6MDX8_9LACO|nr:class I SAM-dependent methyltransferase [Dellaglioa algida]MDK1717181.1 class I SAM-dependent methyltransferase [Dellaglioa algida]MDK1720376.1 class I SAM-dependent methyltransferase [Dellaglioa algida]MDK1722123.1 class I SAM-dependent methyltransferase [Dellaglioa algida]MDK1723759.1 class I SAM-dependent methyltransferase [Dellaglioa algida]MDK1725340.1 class I SAM-dependent methyltransferase [Dellaglioa algida]